jgi:uncharacterized membrane protein (UPF0182 family)
VSKKFKAAIISVSMILILLLILLNSTSLFVDYQWFKEVNYIQVFWYKFLMQLKIFGATFIITSIIFYIFLRYIKKEYASYSKVVVIKNSTQNKLMIAISVIISFFFSIVTAGALWNDILMFNNSTNFNVKDPVFNKDISFYMFKLPLIEKIYSISFSLLIFLVIFTVIFYVIILGSNLNYKDFDGRNKLNLNKDMFRVIINKLAIFVCVFFVLLAIGYKIKAYSILYSNFGSVFGAGYTDVFVSKPFYNFLCIITLVIGISFIVAIRKKKFKFVAGCLVLFLGINILRPISEGIVQNLVVNANELGKEQKYILNNIKFTKKAYGLDNIKQETFNINNKLTKKDIEDNKEIINNIRINEHNPALQVYNQIQGIRPYYEFKDVDVDRYKVGGKEIQMFVSAREINPSAIPSNKWINMHLKYTHGYGVVMSPVNSVTSEGEPKLVIKDIPPRSNYKEIKVTKPQIYFGEMQDYYAITNTKLKEFDYPSGDNNKENIYKGSAGIKLNFLNKLLFSVNKGDLSFLLSGYLNNNSKIILNRNILKRAEKIAPFLTYDNDPYLVINGGQIYWVIDAYTTSDRYPYAQSMQSGVEEYNYIRNSVKVLVNAYDGTTQFYTVDKKDPILKTYTKIFKNMFKDISKMPSGIRKHLRYPQQLFESQNEIIKRYHVSNPQVFYNNEDAWNVAVTDKGTTEPHYLHMVLPGNKNMEFTIMTPFTPKNKQNLVAWLCGRNDGTNYGKLILYKLPKQELIYGPSQINARINQDSVISPQITLWNQKGSTVTRDSLFIVPIEKSLLYVQPLYIRSSGNTSIPELKKVIVVYNDKIVMEDNLRLALNKIFNISNVIQDKNQEKSNIKNGDVKSLIKSAADSYDNAVEAQKRGDWAEYGRQLNNLKDSLTELKKK